MKIFSKLRFKAATENSRLVFDPAGGRVSGRDVSVVLRDAAIAAPQPTDKPRPETRSWPDNCNELSRVAPQKGNVKVLTKEKCQVLAERNGWSIERAKGYVDGETCRQRARKPSKYALIGIDEYSLGFRAGYYERRQESSILDAPRVTDIV